MARTLPPPSTAERNTTNWLVRTASVIHQLQAEPGVGLVGTEPAKASA